MQRPYIRWPRRPARCRHCNSEALLVFFHRYLSSDDGNQYLRETVKVMEYVVEDFMKSCVTAYKDICGDPNLKLRKVDTPFLTFQGGGDSPAPLVEGEMAGELAPAASSILMKILYGARAARWDILKAVQILSTRITMWSRECDKALHRLVC